MLQKNKNLLVLLCSFSLFFVLVIIINIFSIKSSLLFPQLPLPFTEYREIVMVHPAYSICIIIAFVSIIAIIISNSYFKATMIVTWLLLGATTAIVYIGGMIIATTVYLLNENTFSIAVYFDSNYFINLLVPYFILLLYVFQYCSFLSLAKTLSKRSRMPLIASIVFEVILSISFLLAIYLFNFTLPFYIYIIVLAILSIFNIIILLIKRGTCHDLQY